MHTSRSDMTRPPSPIDHTRHRVYAAPGASSTAAVTESFDPVNEMAVVEMAL